MTCTGLLFELAKSPKDQQRILTEIRDVRERIGAEGELTASDYDSMPFFNAAIKVCLSLDLLYSSTDIALTGRKHSGYTP